MHIDDHARVAEALRRISRHVLGSAEETRSRRLAAIAEAGATDQGVMGFGPSVRWRGKTKTDTPAIRVLVRQKQTPAQLSKRGIRSLPHTSAGMAVDVVTGASAVFGVGAPGEVVKSAFSHEFGSLTCILDAAGGRYIVSASHVLAPADLTAAAGASVLLDDAPSGTLSAWTSLVAGGSTTADVALAQTTLPATTAWSDGSSFSGGRDYDPANGPFDVFGSVTGSASGDGRPIRANGLTIAAPLVGPILYTAIALLDIVTSPGDSGGPVRDRDGFLVGMIVGGTQTGKTAMTPWQSLGAAIDNLAV